MDITPDTPFTTLSGVIREHARLRPDAPALQDDGTVLSYAVLDAQMDRVAAAFQRAGVASGQAVAVCAQASVRYAVLFLGALRAGVVVAPLSPSVTRESLAGMIRDAATDWLFLDRSTQALVPQGFNPDHCVALDGQTSSQAFDDWLAPAGTVPEAVDIAPEASFNIIYSSGTTGSPKGIVQSHGMRWTHVRRGLAYGYGPQARALLSTPLYSNTTLVVFFPTLAFGGCVHLMPKFDALRFLELGQAHRITHTMLVPVQYQRIMALPAFSEFDLSSFRMKFCTSAPFAAALKADICKRWPGGLVEFYGMTEGGGTCILNAHEQPDKLHTVGQPAAGHDIRLIDEHERELPAGQAGEVVGHSAGMMTAYHGQPEATRAAEWFDAQGKRFIRTGDIGRFDADGFLTLIDRCKDMIISGGFNVYPSDIEAQLRQHPAIQDAAVIGVASPQWGETPIAFVVRHAESTDDEQAIMAWHRARAGKTQRLSALHFVDELPRSPIGKVLKRELRDAHARERDD